MHKQKTAIITVFTLLVVSVFAGTMAGCDLFGGGLSPLPFARLTAVQLFAEPNHTVAFSVEGAVSNPSLISKINWVFGDGGGFVEGPAGRASITHRYEATGRYEVTAFIFDTSDFVAQIDGTVTVLPNGESGEEGGDDDVPGGISGPNPEDEAENVAVDVTLTWTGSENASSYNVYLGTTEATVLIANGAVPGIFRGNYTDTQYDPMGLDPDTQYFWRVDELNAAGMTRGEVLSFTTATAPEQTDDFIPVDGAGPVPVTQVLSWAAATGATGYDIYFSRLGTPLDFQVNQSSTTYDPEDEEAGIDGQLLPATTYYWRIDTIGLGGTVQGEPLQFTTADAPAHVTGPNPANGTGNINVLTNLSWTANPAIESFDVYFGIDEVSVGAATRTGGEFKGNQTSTIFDPGTLFGSTTYYWRIDTLGPGGTTTGTVFVFTTAGPPPQVVGPFTPTNNETNVASDIILEWSAGGATDSFDVYLSTNEIAVANGSSSALKGNQDATVTQYDPLGLTPDTDYFWRIDALGPGGTTTGQVLRFHIGALPAPAEFPVPENGATGVALDTTLQWTAGVGAISHRVYFGTVQSAVQNADKFDAEYKGTQAGTTYTPPDELEGGTTYYWRIDEESPGGSTKGSVWNFTTAPGRANNPMPLHEETGVALNIELSWTAGNGAVSHDVYFGTVEADVLNATIATVGIFKGNQADASYVPEDLDGMQDYYWRIDEVGNPEDGTTKGDVWRFTTGIGQAAEPIAPPDGETGVAVLPTLSWTKGEGAVSHDVYLGTDETAVGAATPTSAEFKGNQADAAPNEYSVTTPLEYGTVHYWRIDERDTADNVTKGNVWQFTTTADQAFNPDPPDGETGVALAADLSWMAGDGAASHEVYFGTTSGALEFKGDQSLTTYDPGELDPNTMYYWRIDEVGPGGSVTAGTEWEFRTVPGQAELIAPLDGETGVAVLPTLSWTKGEGAVSHDVYLGTDEIAVGAATPTSAEFKGNQVDAVPNEYTVTTALVYGTVYYWRIDERDAADNVTKGSIWQFTTTADQAFNPDPPDGETGVALDADLSWMAGEGATSHRVYFGTTSSALEFKGNQLGTTYDPGDLDPDTYYWRIDEVGPGGSVTEGIEWSFTTP